MKEYDVEVTFDISIEVERVEAANPDEARKEAKRIATEQLKELLGSSKLRWDLDDARTSKPYELD